MPGIIEAIANALHANGAQPVEAVPAFDPQVIQDLHEGAIPVNAYEQAQLNARLDNFALQAQPGQVVHFDGEVPRDPVRQIEFFRYEGEPIGQVAPAPPMQYQQQYFQQPWEFRQQVFPQAIETRLSADDVEKIAQRVLVLIEEREAE